MLVTIATSAISFGVLLVIAAWIAGPTRAATAVRREAAPYLRERRDLAIAALALVFAALIAWAPVSAFRMPIGILLLALLLVIGAAALRRQTGREFPDARMGDLGARTRERLRHPRGRAADTSPATEGGTPEELRLQAPRAACGSSGAGNPHR